MKDILYKCNCIEYGSFKLKSGIMSNYYIDLRKIYSYPKELIKIAELICLKVDITKFNYIAGVPYGAVPVATLVATILNKPLLLIRKEAKDYGKQNLIEGLIIGLEPTVLLIEDVITTGVSIKLCLNNNLINVSEIITIVDRSSKPITDFEYKSLIHINEIRILKSNIGNNLYKQRIIKKTNLILSVDISDMEYFFRLIKYIGPYIIGIKTHIDLLDSNNLELFYNNIENIKREYNIFWIEDRKFSDIGAIMVKQYQNYIVKPDLITVHGISGAESVIELNNSLQNTGILLVYEMSSIGSSFIFNDNYKEYIMNLADTINAVGLICQNNYNNNLLSFTPGINLNDNSIDSQSYSNPENKNSDFYIVGRGILKLYDIYESYINSILYRNKCLKTKINLSCSFLGKTIAPIFYNAAGVHCTTYKELLDLEYSSSGIILSKSCTLESRIGNEQPRYYIDDDISINSTGLANLGIKEYSKFVFNKPYIISLAAINIDDFIESLSYINSHNVFAIEVNISCPNIDNFTENALINFEKYLMIMQEKSPVPWGLKMSIFKIDDIIKYVNIIKKYNVSFIVCANSLSNGLVLNKDRTPIIKPRNGLGGIGGCYGFKALALSNAREFRKLLDSNIYIIGCGGIKNTNDILDYLSVGCSLVQIGSELDRSRGLDIFKELIYEFDMN